MKKILNSLFENRQLSAAEAKQTLIRTVKGDFNDLQVSAFMTVFAMRKISVVELGGFRDALIELGEKLDLSDFDVMDLCGTGGDNKDTFNISTLSSLVVAGAGIPIAKHGNYSVSSACGSSDILEHFGYKFKSSEEKIKLELQKAGICFLHAPLFQPSLKRVAQIRKELQVKTFFNMLGPLIHPASPNKQLLGVYSPDLAKLYSEILKQTNKEYVIVHSLDGFDEISLTGDYRLISRGSDQIINPSTRGFKRISEDSLKGGKTIEESAKIFLNILSGEGSAEQNEVVVANSSAAIACYYPKLNHEQTVEMAKESLLSKKALHIFKKLIN